MVSPRLEQQGTSNICCQGLAGEPSHHVKPEGMGHCPFWRMMFVSCVILFGYLQQRLIGLFCLDGNEAVNYTW